MCWTLAEDTKAMPAMGKGKVRGCTLKKPRVLPRPPLPGAPVTGPALPGREGNSGNAAASRGEGGPDLQQSLLPRDAIPQRT